MTRIDAAATDPRPGIPPAGPATAVPNSRSRNRVLRSARSLLRTPALLVSWLIVLVVVAWAIAPGMFSSFDPIVGVGADKLQGPSLAHFFGTDSLGRDVLSRVIHGSILSLSGAFVAVTVGLIGGTLIGLLAGSIGGVIDDALMRLVDVLLAIPGLLLALTVIILLGFGTINAAIAVGIGSIATFARVTRSEVVRVRRAEYVEAAFGSGGRFFPVLWRHVLPNSVGPVISLAALQFGSAILSISTLGFLGYGSPPPTPEWGLLISEGRNFVGTAWWLTALPGLVVVLSVLSVNRISHSIGRSQS